MAGLGRLPDIYVVELTTLALILGAAVAWFGPKVKRVPVVYPNLPEELDGFRILQISDLHVGPSTGRRYVEKVVRKSNALQADMVALTGDIGDGDIQRSAEAIAALGDLRPRERLFYVSGNHEYYWNIDAWLGEFRKIGMKILMSEAEVLAFKNAKILIAGIPDKMAEVFTPNQKPGPASRFYAGLCDFKILLSHRPGVARKASEIGFDLQLSGHTHGGQFFPWTLVDAPPMNFMKVFGQVGKMWNICQSWHGHLGPPLRLGTTPEVTLITLHRGLRDKPAL